VEKLRAETSSLTSSPIPVTARGFNWPSFFRREQQANVKQSVIVIVIIGPVGVRKSSFINVAADANLEVYQTLGTYTTEFSYVRCTFEDSREVVFVDTPPFPDPYEGITSLSEERKVGNNISEWVKEALGKRIKVTRILYLHDISLKRLTQPLPHYEIFRKLCGKEYSASVALVLTMCENVAPARCQERTKFYTDYWKKMMGERAVVYSHNGTKKSAWDVVAGLGVI